MRAPHLHYEFRINGTQSNPANVAQVAPAPLKAVEGARSRASIAAIQSQLTLAKQFSLASSEQGNS